VPIEVTCDCVDMSCTTGVQIPLHEFAEIDRATNRFLVVPGHELPDLEEVVERRDRFLIVAKRGAGADLVDRAPNSRAESNSATKTLTRPRPKEPPPPRPPWAEPGFARACSRIRLGADFKSHQAFSSWGAGRRMAQVTSLLASPSLRSSSSGSRAWSSQTHSLEGGPDRTLSGSQRL